MILSGGWCKEEQGTPCQAWQSLEGPLEVLPWSSEVQHLLSRSLGPYRPEKAQGPGNWAPGRQRWGCRKQSGQCRLRPGQGEGGQMGWLQASEWAAARMPMTGVPKEPPTYLPTSVQPRERRGGPCGPSPALGAGGWPCTGLGNLLGSTRGGGWGSFPGQRSRGQRKQQPAAGPSAHRPEIPTAFPTPTSAHLCFLSWGQAYGAAGRVGGWPQGLRQPLPPLEGPLGSPEACSIRWEHMLHFPCGDQGKTAPSLNASVTTSRGGSRGGWEWGVFMSLTPPTAPPRSPPSPMTPCRAAPSLTFLQA